MIWHHDKFIHGGIIEMFRNRFKTFACDFAIPVQTHRPLLDFAEEVFASEGAYGYKISTRLIVPVVFQPQRMALELSVITFHERVRFRPCRGTACRALPR